MISHIVTSRLSIIIQSRIDVFCKAEGLYPAVLWSIVVIPIADLNPFLFFFSSYFDNFCVVRSDSLCAPVIK